MKLSYEQLATFLMKEAASSLARPAEEAKSNSEIDSEPVRQLQGQRPPPSPPAHRCAARRAGRASTRSPTTMARAPRAATKRTEELRPPTFAAKPRRRLSRRAPRPSRRPCASGRRPRRSIPVRLAGGERQAPDERGRLPRRLSRRRLAAERHGRAGQRRPSGGIGRDHKFRQRSKSRRPVGSSIGHPPSRTSPGQAIMNPKPRAS